MSDAIEKTGSPVGVPERRRHARQPVCSLAYVDMGEDNGGLIIDISENGFAVQTAVGLIGDRLPHLRFQLPGSENWVEAGGRLAWTGKSLKEAGIEFVDLSDEAHGQIRDWISSEASGERYRVGNETTFEEGGWVPGLPAAHISKSTVPQRAKSDVADEEAVRNLISSENVAIATRARRESGRPIQESVRPDLSAKKHRLSSISPVNIAKTLRSDEASTAGSWPAVHLLGPTKNSGIEANWRSTFARINAKDERRSWKTLATVISLLAVISFFAGTAFGPRALNGIPDSLRRTLWGGGAPSRDGALPSADANLKVAPTMVAQEDEHRSQPAANTASGSFVDGNVKAASPNKIQASQSPTSAQNSSMANLGEKRDSAHALLDMDIPESASDSIAISTRRSIPTLPGVKVVTPRLKESLQIGELIHRVEPVYPQEADQERIEGTVRLHAVIGKSGAIRSLRLISGPPLLVPPAMAAVREWRYNPTLFERRPIETEEDISIVFRLPR